MADLISSLSQVIPPELVKSVREELVRGWRMSEVEAYKQADKIAQENKNREGKVLKGGLRMKMRVPADAFHYWGNKFKTYDCWKDSEFQKDFMKANPGLVVKNEKKTVVNGAVLDKNGRIIQ